MLKKLFFQLENYLFPPTCIICNAQNRNLCPACRLKIKIHTQLCPICKNESKLGLICMSCQVNQSSLNYDGLFIYSSKQKLVRKIISAFQNKGLKDIGLILGKMMGRKIMSQWPKNWKTEKIIIIPSPLDSFKYRQRSYNQNNYLAHGIAKINNWPCLIDQYKLSKQSSLFKNKKNKFNWQGNDLKNKIIVLVIDLILKDSNLNLAAKELKKVGANKVIILAFSDCL